MNNKFVVKKTGIKYTYILPYSKREIRFSRLNYKMTKDLNTLVAYESVSVFYSTLVDILADVCEGVSREEILEWKRIDFESMVLEVVMRSTGSRKGRNFECSCKHNTEFELYLEDTKIENLEHVDESQTIQLDDNSYITLTQQTVASYLNYINLITNVFHGYTFNTEFSDNGVDLILDFGDENVIKLDLTAFAMGNYVSEVCLDIEDNQVFTPDANGGDMSIGLRDIENLVYSIDDINDPLFVGLNTMIEHHPTIVLPIEVVCEKCEKVHKEDVSGLQNFF